MRILFIINCLITFLACSETAMRLERPLIRVETQKHIFNSKKNPINQQIVNPPPPLILPKKPKDYPDLNKPISISVKDMSLKQLLISIAKQIEINLVIDEEVVDEKVNVNLKDVPFIEALQAILNAHDLYFKVYPGYLRISRMLTKIFHIDYVVSIRGGQTNTEVSLSSGNEGGTTQTVTGTASSVGDISVSSSEVINFWENFEKGLKEILKDPFYNLLQSEYNRKLLQQQLALLPYQEEYQRKMQKQQLELLSLQQRIWKKQLELGEIPQIPQSLSTTETEVTTQAETAVTSATTTEIEQLLGNYIIDRQTGTVIVTTTPQNMKKVEKFIAKVKEEISRQVLIDVQIFEVSLDETQKTGIDWGRFPGMLEIYQMPKLRNVINAQIEQQAEESGGAGGMGAMGMGGVYSPLMTSPFPAAPGAGLQVGILKTPTSSFALQWTNEALISFLKTQGEVKAISRPQLLTMNNQPAIVSVGINDFYVTYEQATTAAQAGIATTTVTSRVNPLFIGVTLNITPQISPKGEIILKIVPAINKKVGEKTVPTGIPSAPTQTIPIIETRQTSTIVRAKNGQSIIISGLIFENKNKIVKKVPGLSSVPILGHIFKYNTEEMQRSELVIVLTPYLQINKIKKLGYKHIEN